MTPEQERELVDSAVLGVQAAVDDAHQEFISRILDGQAADEALDEMEDKLNETFAAIFAFALSKILERSVSPSEALQTKVAGVELSRHLAQQIDIAQANAKTVLHELEEAVRLAKETQDADVLRAAKTTIAERVNDLNVLVLERVSYFWRRLMRTELHRSYANNEALRFMLDDNVQYLKVSRWGPNAPPCMCDGRTGVDKFGLGKGIYPKEECPVPPYHPNCLCQVGPVTLPKSVQPVFNEEAERYFLRGLGTRIAARVAGSKEKLDAAMSGVSLDAIANSGRDPMYWIKKAGQIRK